MRVTPVMWPQCMITGYTKKASSFDSSYGCKRYQGLINLHMKRGREAQNTGSK